MARKTSPPVYGRGKGGYVFAQKGPSRKTIPAQRPLAEKTLKAPSKTQTARKTTRRVQTVGKKTALKAVAQKRVARKAPRKTQAQKIKYTKAQLDGRLKQDLLKLATRRGIVGRHSMTKDKLVDAILKGQRGIIPACPPKKYACKRTGPRETPARTDRGGCRYCKLHPKRKIAQRKLPCSERKPRTSCKGKGLAARRQPRWMQYRTGDKKMYCSKCRKSKR